MSKTRKLVIAVLGAISVLSFAFSAVTYAYARYVFERGNNGSITAGNDLPIDVLNKVEVNDQEDLFLALENGYPYIALGEAINDPLIITQDTMTVQKSLILDINGKEIQRVSEHAMLTVGPNVTLTIIDSKKNGSFYNPVGTVLDISGGILDVRGGKFESGPRTWEYYSNEEVKNSIVAYENVKYFSKGNETTGQTLKMPIINPTISSDTSGEEIPKLAAINGNIYFDVQHADNSMDKVIKADTYCFYITSDNFTSGNTVAFDNTVADFSYTYYAYPYGHTNQYGYISDTVTGVKAILNKENAVVNQDYVEVTVYGFENVIQTAMGYPDGINPTDGTAVKIGDENAENSPYYATIKMSAGKLTVNCRGGDNTLKPPEHRFAEDGNLIETSPNLKKDAGSGSFISYFGVKAASCIFFTGGEITIDTQGAIATVDPKTIYDIYHPNSDTTSYNIYDDKENEEKYNKKTPATAFASEGRGLCVHGHSGENTQGGKLAINGGFFYAYNHNLVRMDAGSINIDGDTKESLQFYKVHRVRFYHGYDHAYNPNDADSDPPTWLHSDGQGGIYSSGGTTSIGEARIYMAGGTLTKTTIDNISSQTYVGKQGVYGIYATGGEIKLHNVDINIRGQGSVGVASLGGKIIMTGSELTKLTEEQEKYYEGFLPEMREDMTYFYSSNIFVIGYNTKGVLVQNGGSVNAQNTAIFVSRAKGNALPSTFLSGIDILSGTAAFYNCRIQSDGYGITMTNGTLAFDNSRLASYNASAIVLGGGFMRINYAKRASADEQVTAIKCHLTEKYVELSRNTIFTGLTRPNSAELLYTYAGIDIKSGQLEIQSGTFNYSFSSDKVTPKAEDRIDDTVYAAGLYKKNCNAFADNSSMVMASNYINCQGPGGFLPAECNAIRVVGGQTTETDIAPVSELKALNIYNTNCTITSECGGGILVRGGNVVLGSELSTVNKKILIQTTGTETWYGKSDGILYAHSFTDKNNWQYLDNKTGGDAMFVSGGNVTTYTSHLELHAAHGNGLFVTGSSCVKKIVKDEKGNITENKYTYDPSNSDVPEVTINGGKFVGNYKENDQGESTLPNFNFTGPSSHYGIKVVCESWLTIKGGDISGYGGICTMGSIIKMKNITKEENYNANLIIDADYSAPAKRVTISSFGADAGGFYNNSNVTINSIDAENVRVKAATETEPATPEFSDAESRGFGLIVNGRNTCFVIEKNDPDMSGVKDVEVVTFGTTVNINGGFYCATKGDVSGGKAFWCGNKEGTLNIYNGWLIGNLGGGAVQGDLNACNLYGGHFINDGEQRGTGGNSKAAFTVGLVPTLADGKEFYRIDIVEDKDSGYYYYTESNETSLGTTNVDYSSPQIYVK